MRETMAYKMNGIKVTVMQKKRLCKSNGYAKVRPASKQ